MHSLAPELTRTSDVVPQFTSATSATHKWVQIQRSVRLRHLHFTRYASIPAILRRALDCSPMRTPAFKERLRPIRGLFAVGNDMHSIMRGAYPGPGVTLGPALVFAYAASKAAAQDLSTSRAQLGQVPRGAT